MTGIPWLDTKIHPRYLVDPPRWVLGIDEVGCGCLAGPMLVGAVLAPVGWTHAALRDSKAVKGEVGRARVLEKLSSSPGARYYLYRTSPEEVDRLGIGRARVTAYQAMCQELAYLEPKTLVVIDGTLGPSRLDVALLPKADTIVPHVMAAAMTAKVARDTEMILLARQYPNYGFENHKGYGTDEHIAALEKYGPCVLHRRSYKPIRKYFESSTSVPSGG